MQSSAGVVISVSMGSNPTVTARKPRLSGVFLISLEWDIAGLAKLQCGNPGNGRDGQRQPRLGEFLTEEHHADDARQKH